MHIVISINDSSLRAGPRRLETSRGDFSSTRVAKGLKLSRGCKNASAEALIMETPGENKDTRIALGYSRHVPVRFTKFIKP